MKKTTTLFFILYSFSGCFSQTLKEEYTACAIEKINEQDYQAAILYFTRVIELYPTDSLVYFDRAMVKEQVNDYKGALADYSKAIAIDSSNQDAYYYRGLVKYSLQDFRGAHDDYTRVLELEPDNPDVYFYRAISSAALQDSKEALADYSKAIALHTDHTAEAYAGMAKVKTEQKDMAGALADYDQAIAIEPVQPAYYLKRAELKLKMGQKENACRDIAKYRELGGADISGISQIRCK